MKITLAQINCHVGNFEGNLQNMIAQVNKAKESNSDLIVFPELAVSGYPPRDFLDFDDFVDQCVETVERLAKECIGIAVIVGSPSHNPKIEGKDLFNSAFFCADGMIKYVVHKSLLPTYDIFDEYRYFEPCKEHNIIEYKGQRIALTICEDLWNIDQNPLYTDCPMDTLIQQRPDLMINIAASPFSYQQARERDHVLSENSRNYKIPLIYVNHVGAQTELIFDGGSCIYDLNGKKKVALEYFKEKTLTIDLSKINELPTISDYPEEIELIHDGLVLGIKDYFRKLGFERAILGLSGGIDSALVAVLACKALGPENVKLVMMPSPFSSDHSVNDAKKLAENLGAIQNLIPIHQVYNSFLDTLKPVFGDRPFDITEENIQARVRGVILMALSNKFGSIVLNTSNKSEAAVGYGTLYGDMCGGISVIGDLYKTKVYSLCNFINRDAEIIPQNTLTKPPSAELRPDQKDSDSLPPYDILDEILFQYIEMTQSPKDIIDMGYDESLVKRILRMVNVNEYKRYQTPPILRVTTKAFGMGRRMPIVAKYLS